jgi:hypothetical protein
MFLSSNHLLFRLSDCFVNQPHELLYCLVKYDGSFRALSRHTLETDVYPLEVGELDRLFWAVFREYRLLAYNFLLILTAVKIWLVIGLLGHLAVGLPMYSYLQLIPICEDVAQRVQLDRQEARLRIVSRPTRAFDRPAALALVEFDRA